MAIKFQDFQSHSTGLFSSESAEAVARRMNAWLDENRARVINVETLIDGGGNCSVSFRGFRVWYSSEGPG